MEYYNKDLEGKLQEDLEILDRLKTEGHNIFEPKPISYEIVPNVSHKNMIAEVNKSFITIFKEKLQSIKNVLPKYENNYELTKEEEQKLNEETDPINKMNVAAKQLVRKYSNKTGSLEIILIVAVTAFAMGMIFSLMLIK